MSNPLLRPDDRFQPKSIVGADGSNPFSEGEGLLEAEATAPPRGEGVFAPPGSTAGRPFVPQYETTAEHRGRLLLFLTGIAAAAAMSGLFASYIGWLFPILGLIPAGTVIFLAAEDLRMMKLGGRNAEGRFQTILAMLLSIVAVISSALIIWACIAREISLLPS
jgi:hypothetical protein